MSGLYVRFIIQLLFCSVNSQNLVFILRTGERMVICRFDRESQVQSGRSWVKVDGPEIIKWAVRKENNWMF